MNRLSQCVGVAVVAIAASASIAEAQLTTYTNQAIFLAALGPVTVEDFGPCCAFPLGSTLNSQSSYPGQGISPGYIKPGVTYSVAGGPLLIDGGGGFTGGFLDGLPSYGTQGPLMVTFNGTVSGFGFLYNYLSGTNTITVNTTAGSHTFTAASNNYLPDFIGWTSTSANITDAVIAGNDPTFNFAIDDFTFDAVQPSSTVPEPASVALLATSLLGVAGFARRRRRSM